MNNDQKTNQIKLSSKTFQAIIEAFSENSIFSVTDEKGDIVYVNPKFIDISQYSFDELIGQNHRMLKSGHQSQEIFVDLWKTISSGNIWKGEIKNRAKDGSYYWVDATIIPIFGEDGKISNYAALRTVISSRKDYEEKIKKHIEELEKMNKFTIDRELRMIELKEDIKILKDKLAKYEGGEEIDNVVKI